MSECKLKKHRGCLVACFRNKNLMFVREQLVLAHEFLVAQGIRGRARRAACVTPPGSYCSPASNGSWGTDYKRARVSWPPKTRPEFVGCDGENFIELVNQLATVERLIDALKVIDSGGWFKGQMVEVCHPTVSHHPGENDLVLQDDGGNVTARFEVSDISGGGTGAKKDRKDLASLNVLKLDGKKPEFHWPTERLFLIVSTELADRISPVTHDPSGWKRRWHEGKLNYIRTPCPGPTVILEVKQGE